MSDNINKDILHLHPDKDMDAIDTMGSCQDSILLDTSEEEIDHLSGISQSKQ